MCVCLSRYAAVCSMQLWIVIEECQFTHEFVVILIENNTFALVHALLLCLSLSHDPFMCYLTFGECFRSSYSRVVRTHTHTHTAQILANANSFQSFVQKKKIHFWLPSKAMRHFEFLKNHMENLRKIVLYYQK